MGTGLGKEGFKEERKRVAAYIRKIRNEYGRDNENLINSIILLTYEGYYPGNDEELEKADKEFFDFSRNSPYTRLFRLY